MNRKINVSINNVQLPLAMEVEKEINQRIVTVLYQRLVSRACRCYEDCAENKNTFIETRAHCYLETLISMALIDFWPGQEIFDELKALLGEEF